MPPLLVISLLTLAVLSIFIRWFGLLLIVEISLYALALLAGGIHVSWKKKDLPLLLSTPLAIAVMHLTWGTGVLWSLITSLLRKGLNRHAL